VGDDHAGDARKDIWTAVGRHADAGRAGIAVEGATWILDPKGKCPICGVQVMFENGKLATINYSVSDRFVIIWSAPARPKRASR
jgi:hypothetical protein